VSARDRLVAAALTALLAWAFVLRLGAAVPNPTGSRFWDERFGLENVHSLLAEGEIRPANGYHPSLSYLPQAGLMGASEALHRATGREELRVLRPRGGFTRTGYLLARFLQVVFGTLSLVLLYRIGRRVSSPAVGLWAALVLAAVPWHLRQSAIYKPDILLVLTTLLAFAAALALAERPTRRRFALAGAAVGLALASKYNAGPAAFPVIVAALAGGGWRERRRWAGLLLAGAASLGVFLALNPFVVLDPGLYVADFSETLRHYEREAAGATRLGVLAHGLRSLISPSFLGPVFGTLGLLGLALPGRREGSGAARLGPAMAASYVAGYAPLYALSTHNPSEHNWLPVAPFLALGAARALVGAGDFLAGRLGAARRPAAAAAGLALAAALAVPITLFTWRFAVPTTAELARRALVERLRPLAGRVVWAEEAGKPPAALRRGRGQRAWVRTSDRLDAVSFATLDRVDAEVFELARAEDPFYRRRLGAAGAGGEVLRIAPGFPRARGPGLMVLLHPWARVGKPVPLRLDAPEAGAGPLRLAAAPPPGVAAGETVSLEVVLRGSAAGIPVRRIEVDGRPLEWGLAGWRGGRLLTTERFVHPGPGARFVVHRGAAGGERPPELRLVRWALESPPAG
jgi:hypothetical protein